MSGAEDCLAVSRRITGMNITLYHIIVHQPIDDVSTFAFKDAAV